MTTARTIILRAGEGDHRWFAGGGAMTFKATAADTAGALMLTEFRAGRGKVTPLHLHPDEDEGFYVVDGEVLIHVDGEEQSLGPGGVFHVPRGVAHAFTVTSESVHLLCWQTPGTGQPFYDEVTEPLRSPEDANRPPDWARLQAAASRASSIEILGPAPFGAARENAPAPAP